MTEFGLILGAGLLALALAAFSARPLLSRANRLRSATAVVGNVVAGARACLRLHGRALAVLASPIAFAAFVGLGVVRAHVPTDPVGSSHEHAAWVTLALLFGTLSALLAAQLSTQASVRGAPYVHAALRDGDIDIFRAAMRVGTAASLATHATLLLGLAVLSIAAFGASGGFSDHPATAPFAMARLVSSYGVGAALGSLIAHLQGGSFVASTLALSCPRDTPSTHRPNPTSTAVLIGGHLDLGTGRTSDAHSTSAAGTVIAMVLCANVVQSNPGAFRTASAVVLLPLLACAFSVIASAIGMLVVRTDGVESFSLALDRGLAVTLVLALASFVGLSHWLFADRWLGAFGAAASGVAAFVAIVVLVRTASRANNPSSHAAAHDHAWLGALGRGFLHAALTALIATVAASVGFVCGRTTGAHQGADLGLALVLLGFLAPTPFVLASASLGSVVEGTLGLAKFDVGRGRVQVREDQWRATAEGALALARAAAPVGAALVAAVGVAAIARLAGGTTPPQALPAMSANAWAIAAAAAVLGVSLVFWMAASALRGVERALGSVTVGTDDEPSQQDPSTLTQDLLQAAVRQSVPRVLLAVSLPVLGWVAVRALAGSVSATVLATCCTVAAAAFVGLALASNCESAGRAWEAISRTISCNEAPANNTTVDGFKNPTKNSPGAAVVGNTLGSPLRVIVGPSIHALVKLLATVAVALAPLFI